MSLEECLGQQWHFLGAEAVAEGVEERLRKALETAEKFEHTMESKRKSGDSFQDRVEIFPVRDSDGSLRMVVAFHHELQEGSVEDDRQTGMLSELTANMTLKDAGSDGINSNYSARLADLQKDEVVCVADARMPDCPIVFANNKFFELTQYSPEEVLGRNCRFLQGPDTDPEDVREIREAVHAREACSACILNYKKDGTPFWNHLHIEPVYLKSGDLAYFVASQHDITALMDQAIQCVLSEETSSKFISDCGAFEENQDDSMRAFISNLPTADQVGHRLRGEGKVKPVC